MNICQSLGQIFSFVENEFWYFNTLCPNLKDRRPECYSSLPPCSRLWALEARQNKVTQVLFVFSTGLLSSCGMKERRI